MKLKLLLRTAALTAASLLLFSAVGWGQALLVENFNYTVGTKLIDNGWAGTGTPPSTSNQIMITAPSIMYPGYLGSGVGNEIYMTTSGEDLHKTFEPQGAGYVYVAFLVKFSSAGTGDYFLHLGPDVMGSAFMGRLHVKADAGNIALGIMHSSGGVATYTASIYSLNTTYLVVLKTGVTDKTSSIIVNPAFTATEPVTGWTSNTTGTTSYTVIGSLGVRQGSTTAGVSSTQFLDAIRVATTWAEAVKEEPAPTTYPVTFSVVGANGTLAATVDGSPITSGAAVQQGKNVVFTATPATGFRVKEWKLNGSVVAGNTSSTYTVSALAAAAEVTVEFEAIPPATFPVTFTVIDQKQQYLNVKIKGAMTGWDVVAMTQGPQYTWTVTLQVAAGTYEWGAIEDDGSQWGIWLIDGPNRSFTVAADGTVSGQISYTIPPLGNKSVVFTVDITGLTFNPASDFIDLAGNFTSWSGSDPFTVVSGQPNKYTLTSTATLLPGQILNFKFRKNGTWPGAETPDDPNGKLNRTFVVSAVDAENVVNAAWGENYTRNLGAVAAIADINANVGATVASLNLPTTVSVQLGVPPPNAGGLTGQAVALGVTWDTGSFNSSAPGQVVLEGAISLLKDGVTYYNGYALKATVTVNISTSVGTATFANFSAYPNPFGDRITLSNPSVVSRVTITNLIGQRVLDVRTSGAAEIETGNLPAGVYLVTLEAASGQRTVRKMVKK